jgi:protein phosphatase
MNAPHPSSSILALEVAHGYSSLKGPREQNEDFCGLIVPAGPELESKGVLAALGDGVSGDGGGRQASEYTVRGLLADYYATPDTWAIPFALDKVLNAVNRWLIAQSTAHRNTISLVTTLSALVLRGRRYVVAHVGDSRVYRMRGGELVQLTQDHVWDHPDLRHVLSRAIGLDPRLVIDYADGELEPADAFVLVSDGVWSQLSDQRISEVLASVPDAGDAAAALCRAALDAGSGDNASALVVRVLKVPVGNLGDSISGSRTLPLPPALKVGERIDRFEVLECLHESRVTRLYRVKDTTTGRALVLKTLAQGQEEEAAALLTEEWMARRVHSPCFPEVLPLAMEERSALYYVMSHHEGDTLQALLDSGQHFWVSQTVALGLQMLKGIGALHRLNILHRDIKPANLMSSADGGLRILDLGVALNAGGVHEDAAGAPGTASYMAPELIAGGVASAQTDLYAVGVTLYHLLTRKYPYGEIEPFQHPRFGDPAVPTRYRTDIPGWLEAVILKAVARDPELRFETAEEFVLALERGVRHPIQAPRRASLVEREPTRLWIGIALASIVTNLVLLYLLVAGAAR